MADELLPYYEQELVQLRRLSQEFADQHPKIAGRLQLTGEACADPHVERLIESCAFLAARIHRKLDDDLPELTSNLLDLLYPHYLRPFPSVSIARFDADRNAEQLTTSVNIPRGTVLQTRTVQGVACKFLTTYPVDIVPIRVTQAHIETMLDQRTAAAFPQAKALLTLELERCSSQATFSKLTLPKLRFFLNGEPAVVYPLYQLLFNNVAGVVVAEPGQTRGFATLEPGAIQQVGFEENEGLLNYDPQSHVGYRLLTEYFAYPEKFLFFDLDFPDGLWAAVPDVLHRLELRFVLREFKEGEVGARLLKTVTSESFQLHCSPVINLFKQAGEPIRIAHTRTEYPVVADSRRPLAFEVYSIDSVRRVEKSQSHETVKEIYPWHSLNHRRDRGREPVFWIASRRETQPSTDGGSELFISLVDAKFDPTLLQTETLSIELTCTNRNLPSHLAFRNPEGDLFMEAGSVASVVRFLRKPTATIRSRSDKGVQWRLISHLALNQLSLVDWGADALIELLMLYDFSDSLFNRRQVEAIHGVTAKPIMARLKGNPFPTFVRGMEILVELDEDNFTGGAAYLFGCILERFFGLYVTSNSFTQLRVISKQTKREIAKWAPRSGASILV